MTPSIAPLAPLDAWQAALAATPVLATAAGALVAAATGRVAVAWAAARAATLVALLAALVSLAFLALAAPGAGWGLRVDAAGGIVLALVAFVGWVIVRYSRTYLDGRAGVRDYVASLLATLSAVTVVVVTNHLLVLAVAWLVTSLALHRLLTYFRSRPVALVAAHKKFLVSRLADLAMLGAVGLLAEAFGTLRIDEIAALAAAVPQLPLAAHAAAVLVALAALLRCAQLPFHGWLIQVMEAPTPVSALLHAGVVNLGGFVLLRLAPLVAAAPAAQSLLVAAGAATAVLAALVMTTRISVKVMLAWSTCAQMGFMVMQCGLGAWEMALLHLVAHSLYKAHAFLGAGGAVRLAQVRQLATPAAAPGAASVAAGAAGGLAAAALAGWTWGVEPRAQPALLVLGGIVALALVPLLQPAGAAGTATRTVSRIAAAFGIAFAWFGLHELLAGRVVPTLAPAPTGLVALVAVAFLALFVLQALVACAPAGRAARALYPWFYGGFFLDERVSAWAFRAWPVRLAHDAVSTRGPVASAVRSAGVPR